MASPHAEHVQFCKSRDGTRIAFSISGSGPPLLWAQHWIHHLDFDWRNPIWRPWLEWLAQRYSIVRFDWRGCGLSDREDVLFEAERYVEDFEAVRQAAGLDRFALLGISNGAHFGAMYAAQHPDRVTHLALCSGQSRGRLAGNPHPDEVEEVQARVKMIALGWPGEHPAYRQFSASLHIPDATPDLQTAHTELLRHTTSAANCVALIHSIARMDAREALASVRCPTLVMHARGDSIVRFDEGRMVAALVPGARFIPLESRNHVPLATEPAWQPLVSALQEFLPAPVTAAAAGALEDLTAREREIIELVAQGLNNDAIAGRLSISEKTVRNHVSAIFAKLGAQSRAQAVVIARDAGFGRTPRRL